MGIASFFRDLFTSKKACRIPLQASEIVSQINLCEAAFHACVNLIANAIANCTIKQFEDGKPVKGTTWYMLNYQPNINQSATAFWQKLIHRLYEDNQALVVLVNGSLYVADAFVVNDLQALHEHSYQGVMVDNLQFDKTFYESDVWYFKLHDKDIKALSDQIAVLYAKLMQAFVASYTNARGTKGILKVDQVLEQEDDFEETLNDIINKDFKTFFESTNAVMPIFDGYEYQQLIHDTGSTQSSKEMREQVEAVFETYAMAFGIPKHLIIGDVQDTTEAIEYFLTFTLDPLVRMLESEINRKLFGEKVRDRTGIRFKTNEIKHVDILTVAANIEKLISSGAMTINEVRRASGMDRIDEDFADKFFMTKNFAEIDDLLQSLERRKTDETGNAEETESS